MLKSCFFSKNIQNNEKITVIVGGSHSDVFRKKVEKLQMRMQKKFCKLNFSIYGCHEL